MMSLPVWLPGLMFLPGVSLSRGGSLSGGSLGASFWGVFVRGVSVWGVSVWGSLSGGTKTEEDSLPRIRKVGGIHTTGMQWVSTSGGVCLLGCLT